MKAFISCVMIALFTCTSTLSAASDTFIDYQNYNHGYCPTCNCYPCACPAPQEEVVLPPPECVPCAPCATSCSVPCDPCAPVCGTDCGVSVCAIAVAVAAVVAAAAIVIASGDGSSTNH